MNPEAPRTPREEAELRLTALLMGELPPEEAAAIQAQMASDPELAALHGRLRKAMELLREASALPEQTAPPAPARLSADRRERLLAHFKTAAPTTPPAPAPIARIPRRDWSWAVPLGFAAAVIALLGTGLLMPLRSPKGTETRRPVRSAYVDHEDGAGELTWSSQPGAVISFGKGNASGGQRTTEKPRILLSTDTGHIPGNANPYFLRPQPTPALIKGGSGTWLYAPATPGFTTANPSGSVYNGSATGNLVFNGGVFESPRSSDGAGLAVTQSLQNEFQTLPALPGSALVVTGTTSSLGNGYAGGTFQNIAGEQTGAVPEDQKQPFTFDLNGTSASVGTLSGVNSYSGSTTVTGGTLALSGTSTFTGVLSPITTSGGGRLTGSAGDFDTGVSSYPNAGGLIGGYAVTATTANAAADTVTRGAITGSGTITTAVNVTAARNSLGDITGSSSNTNGITFDGGTLEITAQKAPVGFANGNGIFSLAGNGTLSSANSDLSKNVTLGSGGVPGAQTFANATDVLSITSGGLISGSDSNKPSANTSPTFVGNITINGGVAQTATATNTLQGNLTLNSILAATGGMDRVADKDLDGFADERRRPEFKRLENRALLAEKALESAKKDQSASVPPAVPPPAEPAAADAPAKSIEMEKVAVLGHLGPGLGGAPEEPATVSEPQAPAAIPQPEVLTRTNAFSTFSLNVTDVSFKLAAASLEQGRMPEPSSVRSEEFINAFDYRDPEPAPGAPLAFASERAAYPFAQNRDLLRFSVKTAAAGRQPGRPLNIVLLLDKSGSMERADRVNIVREALRVLTAQLQPQDKLSIVTFARTPRLWADGVAGDKARAMIARVGEITPEGGTNLDAALDLGYATALRHYDAGGVSRVVLFTDGAANLGDVDPAALKKKVEAHRKQGVALDCFGIGWEGYNDDLLEQLTRNGDGRYGFINSPEEAASNFAAQLAGALRVAASDVKVQVEFNPRRVTAYRQIGYAKHQLTKEQFRDNTVNAAQIGAAESGNALYVVEVDPRGEGDLATVRVRFRVPGTSDYREHEWTVPFTGNAQPLEQASPALRLAATAAAFSEMLAGSPYAAEVTDDRLIRLLDGVPQTYGADPRPRKLEWMIRQARSLSGR